MAIRFMCFLVGVLWVGLGADGFCDPQTPGGAFLCDFAAIFSLWCFVLMFTPEIRRAALAVRPQRRWPEPALFGLWLLGIAIATSALLAAV